jgi:leucyl/phenylalanyl-tRNA--protein transferase
MFLLNKELFFPPLETADSEGLLAIGGDLSTERLLLAYRKGIFPWYNEGEPVCWWSPDPRFVLFPGELKTSKSMKTILQDETLEFTTNRAFKEVIENCGSVRRKGQQGTWISPAIKKAYLNLHELGYAHSAETWKNGKLLGGLYGIRLGQVFFGESMFSLEPNASKYAFARYVGQMLEEKVQLIDCQVYTQHLESLGARMVPRKEFARRLEEYIA